MRTKTFVDVNDEFVTYSPGAFSGTGIEDGFRLGGTTGTIASAKVQTEEAAAYAAANVRALLRSVPAEQMERCSKCNTRHKRSAMVCSHCEALTGPALRAQQETMIAGLVSAVIERELGTIDFDLEPKRVKVVISSDLEGWALVAAADRVEHTLASAGELVDADTDLRGYGNDLQQLLTKSVVANRTRKALAKLTRPVWDEFADAAATEMASLVVQAGR